MSAADAGERRGPLLAPSDLVAGAVTTVAGALLFAAVPALAADTPEAGSLVVTGPVQAGWWAVLVTLLLQGAPVAWARRSPRAALLAVSALPLALACAAPGAASGLTGLAVLVVVYRAVAHRPFTLVGPAMSAAGLLLLAAEVVDGVGGEGLSFEVALLQGVAQVAVVLGLPALIGSVVRSRREVVVARLEEQQARTAERDAQVQAALARERTAMARELHDIAAHHLSGIALMAAVVDRQIDSDPEEAHRGARQVRAQSTAVLDDLRRLVGLLREGAEGERSVETLETIGDLVARTAAFAPVELQVRGASTGGPLGAGVGPLAQLAVYRTVQEALTNAASHAQGALCTVEIDDREAAEVVVTITNETGHTAPPPTSRGGFGLLGMSERAELVGAEVRYGPTEAGGWQVRIAVPRDASARRHPAAVRPDEEAP